MWEHVYTHTPVHTPHVGVCLRGAPLDGYGVGVVCVPLWRYLVVSTSKNILGDVLFRCRYSLRLHVHVAMWDICTIHPVHPPHMVYV